MLAGVGSTFCWGSTSALDLGQDANENKILIVAGHDPRHLIQTISRMKRHQMDKVHFYVMETQASVIGRYLLLLRILLDFEDMGMQDRIELFLECYGNLLVREKTHQFIVEQAKELIRIVTDGKGLLGQICDFSQLKFRERDDIEFVLQFWRDSKKSFDGPKLWDNRLIQYLGTRYDTKENAFDWDYHMKLRESDKRLSIIYKQEYVRWRTKGIAFEIRDSTYSHSNRTLATVDQLKVDGVSVNKWGYFSDIVTGPFIGFGVDTENKDMLKTQNDVHKHTSQEISEYNLKSILYEMTVGHPYTPDAPLMLDFSDAKPAQDRIKITFLPCDPSETFVKRKTKYQDTFDAIYVSNALSHRIPDCQPLLKHTGKLYCETAHKMIELKNEQKDAFLEKLNEIGQTSGLEKEIESEDYIIFSKVK
ncbi:hypothetical protein EDD86DRAFT_196799 [Gorgonomyces haynaldii]|nr:hypothetical protein EDD86DRAFT_196799 [Gorgonomyces haynaldii]